MNISEKHSLYMHLADLVMNKKLLIPIKKVYYINNIQEAIKESVKYKRYGKIIVTPKKELIVY